METGFNMFKELDTAIQVQNISRDLGREQLALEVLRIIQQEENDKTRALARIISLCEDQIP
jgi:hypothetical protein